MPRDSVQFSKFCSSPTFFLLLPRCLFFREYTPTQNVHVLLWDLIAIIVTRNLKIEGSHWTHSRSAPKQVMKSIPLTVFMNIHFLSILSSQFVLPKKVLLGFPTLHRHYVAKIPVDPATMFSQPIWSNVNTLGTRYDAPTPVYVLSSCSGISLTHPIPLASNTVAFGPLSTLVTWAWATATHAMCRLLQGSSSLLSLLNMTHLEKWL
jgi:hypothetical protein